MEHKIHRVSTTEAVVQCMLERIRRGELPAGCALPSERRMQEELGVSRLCLREALARLVALGIIRVEHGRGAFVQSHVDSLAFKTVLMPILSSRDEKTLQDLVDIRTLLECEAAALAAARHIPEDIEALEKIHRRLKNSLDSTAEFTLADHEFHRKISAISRNSILDVMLEAISGPVRDFLGMAANFKVGRAKIVAQHRKIIDAIAGGDSAAAEKFTRENIQTCRNNIRRFIGKDNKIRKG